MNSAQLIILKLKTRCLFLVTDFPVACLHTNSISNLITKRLSPNLTSQPNFTLTSSLWPQFKEYQSPSFSLCRLQPRRPQPNRNPNNHLTQGTHIRMLQLLLHPRRVGDLSCNVYQSMFVEKGIYGIDHSRSSRFYSLQQRDL